MKHAPWVRALVVGTTIATLGAAPQAGQVGTPPPSGGTAPTMRFFKNPAALPKFAVTTIDGLTLSPAVSVGKVTLVNFWATWCGPCQAEIPDLIELQKKYPTQLQILGISEDEDGPATVEAFARAHRMNYPVVMATPELHERFPGVPGLPTTFVIDRLGRVVQKHIGLLNIQLVEQETRALAGLPTAGRDERVEPKRR